MSRYRTSPPSRWVIPSVVGASVVAGAVSVPLVLSSGALSVGPDALATTSATPSHSVRATTAPAVRRSASSSLALAGQPPAGAEPGPKTREVSLRETSGPPGSKVVVSGHCLPAADTDAAAGIGGLGVAGAVTRPLSSSGSFSLTLRAPRSPGDIALTVACLNGAQDTMTWHLAYRVLKTTPTSSPATPTGTPTTPSGTPSGTETGSTTGTQGGQGSTQGGQGGTQSGQQNAAPQAGGGGSSSSAG